MAPADESLTRCAEGLRQGSRKHLAYYVSRLDLVKSRLRSGLERSTHGRAASLQQKTAVLRSLVNHLRKAKAQQLASLGPRLAQSVLRFVQAMENSLVRSAARFQRGRYEHLLESAVRSLDEKSKRVRSLSPDEVLRRGYSITRTAGGALIRRIAEVDSGIELFTELADGFVESTVKRKRLASKLSDAIASDRSPRPLTVRDESPWRIPSNPNRSERRQRPATLANRDFVSERRKKWLA